MPNLKEMLEKANRQEKVDRRSSITKGIRPDMLIQAENHKENAAISQPERSQEYGQNAAISQPERSQTKNKNLGPKDKTQLERSQEYGQNAAISQRERSYQRSQNVAIDLGESFCDPNLLVGTQRKVFTYFFELAQRLASLKTPPLTMESISAATGLRNSQIHSSTKQLRLKNCISLSFRKDGRAGWVEYSITQVAFDCWLRLNNRQERSQNVVITEPERSQEPGYNRSQTTPSSSRDNFLYNSSTTQEPVTLFDQVGSLDLSNLREFGITQETFKRAVQLHPTVTIEALSDLSFRLSELFKDPKERAKIQNARGFVIRLVEQLAQGITPLDHIETPDEHLMREYAVMAKQKKVEQQDFENALLQEAFEKWDKETQEEEKLAQVPLARSAPVGSPRIAIFREHFREKVWPKKKEAMLRGGEM